MITVNTFGFFQMTDGKSVLNDSNLNSIMLKKLLIYVLMYRDKALTSEDVANAIWSDDETDNPLGALKNLMYRLRKVLAKQFGDTEFILTDRGTYKWNSKVKVILDVEHFEKYINLAKGENDTEKAVAYYEEAIAIYKGDFMNTIIDMAWVNTNSMYYHSLYLSSIKALSELYSQQKRYEDLEKLCSDALNYEGADEQLYCYQIQARMRCGKINLALESYDKAKEIMEKELGVRKTTILNKVYEELLSMSKGRTTYNIDEIKEDIEEEDPQGVFICGYPIFKEIYQLEARKSTRTDTPEYLVLLTLQVKESVDNMAEVTEFRLKQGMKHLESTICQSLRVGDVAAKYSDAQFIILLPTCDNDLAHLVANRIISKFYEGGSKYKKYSILIDTEEVSPAGEMVN